MHLNKKYGYLLLVNLVCFGPVHGAVKGTRTPSKSPTASGLRDPLKKINVTQEADQLQAARLAKTSAKATQAEEQRKRLTANHEARKAVDDSALADSGAATGEVVTTAASTALVVKIQKQSSKDLRYGMHNPSKARSFSISGGGIEVFQQILISLGAFLVNPSKSLSSIKEEIQLSQKQIEKTSKRRVQEIMKSMDDGKYSGALALVSFQKVIIEEAAVIAAVHGELKAQAQKLKVVQESFKVLGLDEDATTEQISKAFRDLSLIHHPDMPKGSKSAFQKMKEHVDLLKEFKENPSAFITPQAAAAIEHVAPLMIEDAKRDINLQLGVIKESLIDITGMNSADIAKNESELADVMETAQIILSTTPALVGPLQTQRITDYPAITASGVPPAPSSVDSSIMAAAAVPVALSGPKDPEASAHQARWGASGGIERSMPKVADQARRSELVKPTDKVQATSWIDPKQKPESVLAKLKGDFEKIATTVVDDIETTVVGLVHEIDGSSSSKNGFDAFTALASKHSGEMRKALIKMNLPAGEPVTLANVNSMKNNMPALSGVKASVNDDAWLHGYVQGLFNILNRSNVVPAGSRAAVPVAQVYKTVIKNSSDVPAKPVDLEGAAKVLELVMFAKRT